MKEKKQTSVKDLAKFIKIPVLWYEDEAGNLKFDFEEMANEFENKLAELDPNVVVMCSIEEN